MIFSLKSNKKMDYFKKIFLKKKYFQKENDIYLVVLLIKIIQTMTLIDLMQSFIVNHDNFNKL